MARYCPYCTTRIETGNVCPNCNYAHTYRPRPYHLKPGTLLNNKYLVGRVLGEGGFGITYIGRDLTLDMKVAIKEYFPNGSVTRENTVSDSVSLFDWSFDSKFKQGKEEFIKEAQTIAKMDKESAVVTVRDFFEQNNSAYIVMEFIEGEDLKKIVQNEQRPLVPSELFEFLEPVFGALGELHDMGLIHRDISPDNIMLENGRARLIDFGCARELSGEKSEAVLKHSFSPVEQYRNRGMGPWTDVYSMGATIYYCITGKLPSNAMERLVNDTLVSPSELGAKLSKKQDKAIMKALSIEPEDRYQSMEEFGKDLFVHKVKYRDFAIAASAVALIAILAFVFLKPKIVVETAENAREINRPVSLTDSNITYKQKEVIAEATKLIEGFSISRDDKNQYYFNSSVKNTSDIDYDTVYFSLRLYDGKGVLCGTPSDWIAKWNSGDTLKLRFNDREDSGTEKAEVRMEFEYNGERMTTEYVPVNITETAQEVTLELINKLPCEITKNGYNGVSKVTINDWSYGLHSYVSGFTFEVSLDGTYDSGPDNVSNDFLYKVYDESGTVVASGSWYLRYLSPGDRFKDLRALYISNLQGGNYTLELGAE